MSKLQIFINAIAIVLLCTTESQAYLDPSVMTYAIQAVAGILIAVSAGIGIYFNKAKKKVSDALSLENESKKEKEEDLLIYEEVNQENTPKT